MNTSTYEFLISIGAQIPLVVIFIWFVLRIEKASREERSQMRISQKEERTEWLNTLENVASEIREVGVQMRTMGTLLSSHDSSIIKLTTRLEDRISSSE